MEIIALGAARQVGRSGVLIKAGGSRIVLDYGVLPHREPAFPMHVPPRTLSGVFLTHAHLDHTGGVPLLFMSEGKKVISTPATLELSALLLEDFIKTSGFYLPYEYLEVETMVTYGHLREIGEEFDLDGVQAKLVEAGHIPGSASIIIQSGSKRILYTGDINSNATNLLAPADLDYGELDLVISECTYGLNDHPSRQEVETAFVKHASDVVERGGVMLVPAFSVGRAQEIACVLRAHGFKHTVAMDGMALKTNEILMRHQDCLRDPQLFRRTMQDIEHIVSWSQRRKIVKTPSVIIAPAGMLVGGSAVFYMNEVAEETRNCIAIVSYQVPGTPGRTLMDEGLILVNGRLKKLKAEKTRFDFSSHSGRSQLLEMFRKIKGNPKVWLVHGEEQTCVRFASDIRELFGLESIAPNAGESIQI